MSGAEAPLGKTAPTGHGQRGLLRSAAGRGVAAGVAVLALVLVVASCSSGGGETQRASTTSTSVDVEVAVGGFRDNLIDELGSAAAACTVVSCSDLSHATQVDVIGGQLVAMLSRIRVGASETTQVASVVAKYAAFHDAYDALKACPQYEAGQCPMEANALTTAAVDLQSVLVAWQPET